MTCNTRGYNLSTSPQTWSEPQYFRQKALIKCKEPWQKQKRSKTTLSRPLISHPSSLYTKAMVLSTVRYLSGCPGGWGPWILLFATSNGIFAVLAKDPARNPTNSRLESEEFWTAMGQFHNINETKDIHSIPQEELDPWHYDRNQNTQCSILHALTEWQSALSLIL